MRKNHFQSLYSVGVETKYRAPFAEKLSILSNAIEDSSCLFSMSDIDSAINIAYRSVAKLQALMVLTWKLLYLEVVN